MASLMSLLGTDPAPEGLFPTRDAAILESHVVSRPDLVRIDQDGKVSEIATLIVGGKIFEDWETVWIRWEWAAPNSEFKFTCAEREPYPKPGAVLQFAPGNEVEIYLGGIRVINGVIITRQVAYTADQHVVQLIGVSDTWFAARSGIDSKTSDFDGMTFTQIAAKILAPTGVGFTTVGKIDETPFKAGATPSAGETIEQFLERLARDRKIIVSNLPDGRFLFVGEHDWPPLGELVEGINIKKMQCVITVAAAYRQYQFRAQKKADDKEWGPKASEQEVRIKGILNRYSLLSSTIEHPVWTTAEILTRAQTEKMWAEDITVINADVTVYGWFRPLPTNVPSLSSFQISGSSANTGHTLWQAGDEVIVDSPMAMLNNQEMKIRAVTWTQDSTNGSQTILSLCLPSGLNGMPIPQQPSDLVAGMTFAEALAKRIVPL